jgi:3-phenylpropionate/trans-cinnamate dioxygenase ferredoxin subunit
MADWVEVIASDALMNGEKICVESEGTAIAVFKIDGQFYAIEDVCTHDGAEIASGEIDGCEIICPRHGARFCLKTGAVKAAPAYEALACFPIRIAEGKVFVRDNRWD